MVLESLILDNLISCNWVYRHKSSWTWALTTITKLVGCKSGLLCYFQVDDSRHGFIRSGWFGAFAGSFVGLSFRILGLNSLVQIWQAHHQEWLLELGRLLWTLGSCVLEVTYFKANSEQLQWSPIYVGPVNKGPRLRHARNRYSLEPRHGFRITHIGMGLNYHQEGIVWYVLN